MKPRIAIAMAFSGCMLAACPREQTPPHDSAPATEPATVAPAAAASIAPPVPVQPQPPQGRGMRAPLPEPEPLIPPPSQQPVDR